MLVFIFFIFAPWPFSIKATLVKKCVPGMIHVFSFFFSNQGLFFMYHFKCLVAQRS